MVKTSSLLEDVSNVVDNFFTNQEELIFNESELQQRLAIHLQKAFGDDAIIMPEYYMPTVVLYGQAGMMDSHKKERIYIDLVVMRDGKFVPIELKYKTKTIKKKQLSRFGEEQDNINLLQNHGAYPDNKDLCRKDIARLYRLCERFPETIEGGLFIFLTNNEYYPKNFHPSGSDRFNASGECYVPVTALKSSQWHTNAFSIFNTNFHYLKSVIKKSTPI